MLPLIIFDCDGVLVDTEMLSNTRMAEFFTARDYPITPETCRRTFQGTSLEHVCDTISLKTGIPLDVEELRAHVYAGLHADVSAIQGVEFLIRALVAKGYDLCVASSGTHKKMSITLGQTGLLKYFEERLFSTKDVERAKPFPDVFLHAARTMGHDPANAIVIEDSVSGVEAGKAAGARVLGYCGDPFTDPTQLEQRGAETFASMSDALDLIEAHPALKS